MEMLGVVIFIRALTDGGFADRNPEVGTQVFRLVLARAIAMCRRVRSIGVQPILFLDEPGFYGFSPKNPRHVLALQELRVFLQTMRREQVLVGIHCCSNTDWASVLSLPLDILSIDTTLSLNLLLTQTEAVALPASYDPRHIAADVDLGEVAAGIVQAKSGRICLYGPPGTGKTAFGRWLATQLDVPLHAKKVSDIVSPYIGQTERNLARVFREARTEGAVLLLDEVDSFLQDRQHAQRSWEITAVNEMLTQMESFQGVFIASTNLMDGLDQAALRRFDLKVKFDYLRPAQAWDLFEVHRQSLGLPDPEASVRTVLERFCNLTPGDFAAVTRQHRFRPIGTVPALIAALEAECRIKKDNRTPVGFL